MIFSVGIGFLMLYWLVGDLTFGTPYKVENVAGSVRYTFSSVQFGAKQTKYQAIW